MVCRNESKGGVDMNPHGDDCICEVCLHFKRVINNLNAMFTCRIDALIERELAHCSRIDEISSMYFESLDKLMKKNKALRECIMVSI